MKKGPKKKMLIIYPEGVLELETSPSLFRALWSSIEKRKTKFKFYKSQEIKGEEYNGVIINEEIIEKKEY